jgi:hypothetical protein
MSDKTEDRDIEETDELLEAEEAAPVKFWEEKQRELLTSVVDYNLSTLSDLVKAKTIDLQPKYQRRFRWDENRQSKLIESFLMNVPVPPVFLNEDKYGQYSVIDGKQRLTAIHDFMMGRLRLRNLEVFADINNLRLMSCPPIFRLSSRRGRRSALLSCFVSRTSTSSSRYSKGSTPAVSDSMPKRFATAPTPVRSTTCSSRRQSTRSSINSSASRARPSPRFINSGMLSAGRFPDGDLSTKRPRREGISANTPRRPVPPEASQTSRTSTQGAVLHSDRFSRRRPRT